jgi:hypothetical protein
MTFTEIGPVELKGVSGTPRLHCPTGRVSLLGADRRSGTPDG